MKKTLYLLLLTILPVLSYGQSVSNAEDFSAGTVLKFINCQASGVNPGTAGANQIWNFATLAALPDTTTEWLVLPIATPYAAMFPGANLVEKYSDGRYVYLNKTPLANNLTGFIDPVNNVTIHYPNAMLAAVRPLTFGATTTDTYTTNFTASGYNFRGKGTAVIHADGYGSLILPNGTFNNVVRVKATFTQTDTLLQFGTVSQSTTEAYAWFDGNHTSALLKIESTTTTGFSQQTVSYLFSETSGVTGIEDPAKPAAFNVYPNPAKHHFTFETGKNGFVSITNSLGQTVTEITITNQQTSISTQNLKPGIYFLTFRSGDLQQTQRLIIEH